MKWAADEVEKDFCRSTGEILKTEFMEPMGMSAYALSKTLDFSRIYEVVRRDRAKYISASPSAALPRRLLCE